MANTVEIEVAAKNTAGQAFGQASKQSDQLGGSVKRVGEIAAGVVTSQVFTRLAGAAKQAFTSTVNAASNLNESMNAVEVQFGSAADGIDRIGQTADQSMGLSQRAFNEAAVRFSAFAKTIAGSGGDVVGVVEDLTGRAADFASVMNLDVEEALLLFQSGLAGETEPLRRYGIDLSAAAVQAHAMAEGISTAGSEMTEAEKVQARYSLLMQQTSNVQGDFANTSDDLANAQRIFNAELENFQAQAGQNLLPVLGFLVGLASDVLAGFEALPGPLQAVVAVLAAAAALTPGIMALRAAMVALSISMGPISIALAVGGALLGGLGLLGSVSKDSAADVDTLSEAINNLDLAAIANDLEQRGVLEKIEQLGLSTEETVDAFAEGGSSLEEWRDRIAAIVEAETELVAVGRGQTRPSLSERGEAANDLLGDIDELIGGLDEQVEADHRVAEASGEATGAVAVQAEEAEAAAEKIREAAEKIAESWQSAVESIVDANEAYSDAMSELEEGEEVTTAAFIEQFEKRVEEAEKYNENVRAIQEKTSAEVFALMEGDLQNNPELAATIAQATGKEFSQIEGLYRDSAREASELANDAFIDNIPELQRIGADSGDKFARKVAQKIREGKPLTVSEVKKIMSSAKTEVEATELMSVIESSLDEDSRAAALARIQALIVDRIVNIFPRVGDVIGGIPKWFATGGPVGAATGGPRGTDIVVNDGLNPEAIRVPDGSTVIPSIDQLTDRDLGGGGRGQTINIYVQGSIRSDRDLIELIRNEIDNGGFRGLFGGDN